MNSTYKRFFAMGVALVASLAMTGIANAVPAFARQMDTGCDTCHFQHFPLLNSFGRAFKASGFTMSARKNIENDHISFPENLNMALFTNIRYQSSNGQKSATGRTSNNGEWIIPGETSLFFGGRVNGNVGALVEGDVGGAGTASGDASPFLASIKLPFMYDVGKGINLGVVPFSAGLGPAYAFEVMNTGAVGNHLINLVHPTAVSAQQYIQVGPAAADNGYGGDAEGIGMVAVSSDFFVTLAKWSPNHLPIDTQGTSAAPDSDYARVAYMPQFNGWDMGFGVQYFGGRSSMADGGALTPFRTESYAVDAQAQGSVAGMPVGVYLSYASAPATKAGQMTNLYNPNPNRAHAASVALELGAFSNGLGTVQLAYRTANDGKAVSGKDDAVTAGVTYLLAYNIQFALLETLYSGGAHSAVQDGIDASGTGDRLTTINLAVGF